jgi:transcriptional regulator with XRE-family HTH domain
MYLEWLRKGLQKKGKTQGGLAQKIGIGRTDVNKMVKGTRKIYADELQAIASYIEEPVPHADLGSYSKGGESDSYAFVEAVAGAGIWREAGALTMYLDMVVPVFTDPRVAGLKQHAVRVEGTDFNEQFKPGDLALFVPFWERRKVPIDGDIVELERKRGDLVETTIRRVRVTADGYEFHAESTDPKWKDTPPIRVKDIHNITGMTIVGLFVALHRPNPNL